MHLSLLVLLLLFPIILPSLCARAEKRVYAPRIVNGKEELRKDVTEWQAAFFKGRSIRCGGSLISHNKVLTAAHCAIKPFDRSLTLRIGATGPNDGDEYPILSIRDYEGYRRTPGPRDDPMNDLKVVDFANDDVRLAEKAVILNDNSLFPPDENSPDTRSVKLTVSGYGRLSSQGDIANHLRSVDVPIVPYISCKERYLHTNRTGHICAGSTGADSCQGDSGSGLWRREVVNISSGGVLRLEEKTVLYGIVSYGYGCASRYSPGVYTRVTGYYNWIERSILTPPTPFSAQQENKPLSGGKKWVYIGLFASGLFVLAVIVATMLVCYFSGRKAQRTRSDKKSKPARVPGGAKDCESNTCDGNSSTLTPSGEEVHWPEPSTTNSD